MFWLRTLPRFFFGPFFFLVGPTAQCAAFNDWIAWARVLPVSFGTAQYVIGSGRGQTLSLKEPLVPFAMVSVPQLWWIVPVAGTTPVPLPARSEWATQVTEPEAARSAVPEARIVVRSNVALTGWPVAASG